MNQGNFYSLLPKAWREREQYQKIDVPHQDCIKAENWFAGTKPLAGETTWELYKRYDPDGSRAMNQAQFYSLLPKEWRENEHYHRTDCSYQDCISAEEWFAAMTPMPGETTWELYKRFDPSGTRAPNGPSSTTVRAPITRAAKHMSD